MWHPSSKRNVAECSEDKHDEKGHTDSGFLSGGNLQISSEICEQESLNTPATAPVAPEPMRADSGVDLGLSESLSQLTLKQVTLNPLASGKVQAEPTVELAPVTSDKIEQQREIEMLQHCEPQREIEKSFNEEPWQLYYTQDDDGDT